ncbi:hypothetical protein T439DRAFT_327155 [Meredithblackwellia eburnea MCA 4105]
MKFTLVVAVSALVAAVVAMPAELDKRNNWCGSDWDCHTWPCKDGGKNSSTPSSRFNDKKNPFFSYYLLAKQNFFLTSVISNLAEVAYCWNGQCKTKCKDGWESKNGQCVKKPECWQPSDCKQWIGPYFRYTCNAGKCGSECVPKYKPDGNGHCVPKPECSSASDCPKPSGANTRAACNAGKCGSECIPQFKPVNGVCIPKCYCEPLPNGKGICSGDTCKYTCDDGCEPLSWNGGHPVCKKKWGH